MTLRAVFTGVAAGAVMAMSATAVLAADRSFGPQFGNPAHLEVGVGIAHWGDADGIFEGAGRMTVPWNNPWKLELEVTATSGIWDSNNGDAFFGAYGHFYKPTGMGQVGIVAGLLNNYGLGGVIGAEGRWGMMAPNSVLMAQLTGIFFAGGSAGVNARAEWWNYTNPNQKWGVYGNLSAFNTSSTAWEIGLAGEMRMMGPFSIHGRVSANSFWGTSGWTAVGGFRVFTSNGGTLRQADNEVPFAVRLPFAFLD